MSRVVSNVKYTVMSGSPLINGAANKCIAFNETNEEENSIATEVPEENITQGYLIEPTKTDETQLKCETCFKCFDTHISNRTVKCWR